MLAFKKASYESHKIISSLFWCSVFHAVVFQACLGCCKELIDIDPDLMWLKLCDLHVPVAYIPPDNRFLEIKVLIHFMPSIQ